MRNTANLKLLNECINPNMNLFATLKSLSSTFIEMIKIYKKKLYIYSNIEQILSEYLKATF